MPVLGKEVEHQLSPEQIAVREVQDYVEKIERQAETQQKVQPQQPQQQVAKQAPTDVNKTVSVQQGSQKPKIVLPIDQTAIQNGLRGNVSSGVKWLSEWCVMMIKKYPGRVFYMPPEAR